MPSGRTALVLLASEQLWPNIECLCLYREHRPKVFIYHTSDPARSQRSARALKELAKRYFGFETVTQGGKMLPQAVAKQLKAWMERERFDRWVVNATGGNKLMTIGVVSLVRSPKVEVVYLELTDRKWYQLVWQNDFFEARPLHWADPQQLAKATNSIPVEELIRVAWSYEGKLEFRRYPEALDADAILRVGKCLRGARSPARFRWGPAFRQAGLTPSKLGLSKEPDDGFAFELFIAGSLVCGLEGISPRQVVLGARLELAGMHRVELDVIVNHARALWLVDCSVGSHKKGGRASELREAQARTHELAGLAGGCIVIRPRWPHSAPIEEVASARGVVLIDELRFRRVCYELSTALGTGLSRTGRRIDERLQAALR